MATKRVKPGDVLEAVSGEMRVYLQYLGRHSDWGDVVMVRPDPLTKRPQLTPELFRDGYVMLYPVPGAVAQGLVEVIGRMPAPAPPTKFRRFGAIANDGTILTWLVETDEGDVVRKTLSAEEKQLPVLWGFTHVTIVDHVLNHWRPDPETNRAFDPRALEESDGVSGSDAAPQLRHYLYFPSEQVGAAAAKELEGLGFTTEARLGAEGTDWLVLAVHTIVPTDDAVTAVRDSLEALAERFGGEYDGWEAEVTP